MPSKLLLLALFRSKDKFCHGSATRRAMNRALRMRQDSRRGIRTPSCVRNLDICETRLFTSGEKNASLLIRYQSIIVVNERKPLTKQWLCLKYYISPQHIRLSIVRGNNKAEIPQLQYGIVNRHWVVELAARIDFCRAWSRRPPSFNRTQPVFIRNNAVNPHPYTDTNSCRLVACLWSSIYPAEAQHQEPRRTTSTSSQNSPIQMARTTFVTKRSIGAVLIVSVFRSSCPKLWSWSGLLLLLVVGHGHWQILMVIASSLWSKDLRLLTRYAQTSLLYSYTSPGHTKDVHRPTAPLQHTQVDDISRHLDLRTRARFNWKGWG